MLRRQTCRGRACGSRGYLDGWHVSSARCWCETCRCGGLGREGSSCGGGNAFRMKQEGRPVAGAECKRVGNESVQTKNSWDI